METEAKGANTKRAGGRRPRHDYACPMLLLEIEGLARDGLDDAQVAARLGVTASHFCRLKLRWPALAEALKKGRRPLEALVESALLRRALGMRVRTVVREVRGGGEDGAVRETETELPPDVGAALAWLRHRKPGVWDAAAKTQVELRASGNISIDRWIALAESEADG